MSSIREASKDVIAHACGLYVPDGLQTRWTSRQDMRPKDLAHMRTWGTLGKGNHGSHVTPMLNVQSLQSVPLLP
jgi:hypothetical protein